MKLSQLAAKPQLVEVILNDEDTLAEFNEALTFHTWDRQPLDIFMKLANADQTDMASMVNVVRTLILDEKGKEVIHGDNMIPSKVLIRAISKIVELLGK